MSIQVLNSRILVITQRKVVEGKDVIHAPPGVAVAIKYPIQRVDITTAATDKRNPTPARSGWNFEYFAIYTRISVFSIQTSEWNVPKLFNLEITKMEHQSPKTKAVHTGLSK